MEKKFLDESSLTYLRNYIDGQDKVIYKTAADLVSSTHLESLTRPATQPEAQVIPSITPENEQQNLTIGDGLEIKDGALTTKKAPLELYLNITVYNNIINPFYQEEYSRDYEILIGSRMVVGKIPDYYNGLIEKSSSIVSS